METVEVYYIGKDFYWRSGTAMSGLCLADGSRTDWGCVENYLIEGKAVNIRQATAHEIEKAKVQLVDILGKKY